MRKILIVAALLAATPVIRLPLVECAGLALAAFGMTLLGGIGERYAAVASATPAEFVAAAPSAASARRWRRKAARAIRPLRCAISIRRTRSMSPTTGWRWRSRTAAASRWRAR